MVGLLANNIKSLKTENIIPLQGIQDLVLKKNQICIDNVQMSTNNNFIIRIMRKHIDKKTYFT